MLKDELKAYANIFGISIASVIRFAAIGIGINWLYSIFKISWYIDLFGSGNWKWILIAIAAIIVFFIVWPAIYIYLGYQNAIGKALIAAYNKNKEWVAGLIVKVGNAIANSKHAEQGGRFAASANEYRIVRFLIKRMGYATEWHQLVTAANNPEIPDKQAYVNQTIGKIVAALPTKIAEGFTQNLNRLVLINVVVIIVVEVLSRMYPVGV